MQKQIKSMLLIIGALFILFTGCKKNDHPGFPCDQLSFGENNADLQNAQALKYGVDVPAKWYALAITLSRTTPNQNIGPIVSRTFGYMGLALYESVVPGMPTRKSIQSQLNGLPALTQIVCGERYFYPDCANAALANMVHHMFGNTSAAQNVTIDSLENALNTLFKTIIPNDIVDRSFNFGQAISNDIYKWSVSDGGDQAYLHPSSTTYLPPAGPGLWVPQ